MRSETGTSSRTRMWGRRIALVLLSCLLGYRVFASESPDYRYATQPCVFNLIYGDREEIDLIGIGGSRLLTAFDAHDIQDQASARNIEDFVVYNASHSHYFIEKEFVIARDLLSRHRVGKMVVMLQPREWVTPPISQDMAELAKFSDLVRITAYSLSAGELEGARAFFSAILKRAVTARTSAKECSIGTCLPLPVPDSRSKNCHPGDARHNLASLQSLELSAEPSLHRSLDWNFGSFSQAYHDRFVKAFVDLAHDHDVELYFIYLPRTDQPRPDPVVFDQFYDRYGVQLIMPPEHIRARLSYSGRRDGTHMTARGRIYFLPWLLDALGFEEQNLAEKRD